MPFDKSRPGKLRYTTTIGSHYSQGCARYRFRHLSKTHQSQPARPEHNRINAYTNKTLASLHYSSSKRKAFHTEPLRRTGIILMYFGVLSMVVPLVSSLFSEVLIGSLLVAGGLLRIVILSQYTFWSNFWLPLLSAVLVTILALIMTVFPLHGSYSFTMLLSMLFFIEGIAAILFALAFRRHSQSWLWILFSGVISVLIALVVLYNWPTAPAWMTGTLTGIILLLTGIWYITVVTALPRANEIEHPEFH